LAINDKKIGPGTCEVPIALNTLRRSGYHFEVTIIDLISFLISEDLQKTCSFCDPGRKKLNKVDNCNFSVIIKS
jgi:hypothetical protein